MNSPASFIADSIVQRPSKFILLVDEQYTLNDPWFFPTGDCPTNAHTHGANMEFWDGHLKWFQSSVSQIRACKNAVPLNYFCPSIPFNYLSLNSICNTE